MRKGILIILSFAIILGFIFLAKNPIGQTKNVILKQAEKPAFVMATDYTPESYGLDFTAAAEKTVNGVVHIRSLIRQEGSGGDYQNPYRDFFDFGPRGPREGYGSGSGVVISEDGYIVTNNHVVEDAVEIEVVFNDNRSYEAEVVGLDPTTDLAIIKIEAEDLSALAFANSDETKIGQWVLAVGNPFNLSSTVTAGIISAKARNINILREAYAVESFIQTDAAINKGNSGGALVNLNGDLIGINSAIATPTGTYAGYGFAIPSNLVQKVSTDLIEYGVVQRAIMGVMIRNVDARIAERLDLDEPSGVLVDSLTMDEGAKRAGIKKGDIIVHIDDSDIKSVPELMEYVARKRPGDKIMVSVIRDGNKKEFEVELVNRQGRSEFLAKREPNNSLDDLGIEVAELSKMEIEELDLDGGVKITEIKAGKIRNFTSIKPGFIVTQVNKKPVQDIDDFLAIVESESGGVMLEGVYPDRSGKYYYAFGK